MNVLEKCFNFNCICCNIRNQKSHKYLTFDCHLHTFSSHIILSLFGIIILSHKDIHFFAKIGDFGLARNLMDETYYQSSGGEVPVKWTAPEVGDFYYSFILVILLKGLRFE